MKNFKLIQGWRLHSLIIGIPTLCVFVFTMFFATPQYESESRFFIRSYESSGGAGMGLLSNLLSAQSSVSVLDAEIVRDYMYSSDNLKLLEARERLLARWEDAALDPLTRLEEDASWDAFLSKFMDQLKIEISTSGIMLVRYRDYSAEQAESVLTTLIDLAETYVNSISRKLALEQLDFIRSQVGKAEEDLKSVRIKMTQMQNELQTIDPKGDTEIIMQNIGALEQKLVQARSGLIEARKYLSEDSMQIDSLKLEIQALEDEVNNQKERLVGGEEALNDQLSSFMELQLEEEFATGAYASAYTSLEQAQLEAARKLKALVVIDSASRPEDAKYPRSGYWTVTTFLLTALAYGLMRLIISVVKEHQ